jgi:SAM-dependent methyltransferase
VSDKRRLERLEAELRLHAPLLWNDVGRPPEPPLAPAAVLLSHAAGDDDAAQLAAIDGECDYLVSVYPHARALGGLGPAAIRERMREDTSPIPTPPDREGYFAERPLAYWLSGLADRLLVERIAAQRGLPLTSALRLLDLGCASGRALRHFLDLSAGIELLGVDLGAHHVAWARRHLPPALVVALATTIPSLPLEDASVDVVTAFSVLTHVSEFEESLLLEVRRVLRPGGFALVTYHPERVWNDLRDPDHFLRRVILGTRHRADPPGVEPVGADLLDAPPPGERVVFTNVEWPVYNANVIHSESWVRGRWGRILELEWIEERAHGHHQDAAILGRG